MNISKKTPAEKTAFGGVLAALAIVMMSLGGLIPLFTYTTPIACALILQIVLNACGSRIAWAWYGSVALLGLVLCPDKESAAVFLFIGYYPIVKPWLDRRRFAVVWKLIIFNISVFVLYYFLISLIGLDELMEEFSAMGNGLLVLLVVLGNFTFLLLDRLLTIGLHRRRRGG